MTPPDWRTHRLRSRAMLVFTISVALVTAVNLSDLPSDAHAATAAAPVVTASNARAAETTATLVDLGAAAGFSVLGSTVSNTNISSVEFDVGSTAGPIVGFSPAGTLGAVHDRDTAAVNAAVSLAAAYSDAAGRTPDSVFGGDLNGITLTPGIYNSISAISNTGVVTLDAQGDANAVFILQVDAALSMAAASTVRLINGALPTRVFWQITGAVTLGADTNFRGIMITHAAISLGADATVVGAVLTLNGAVTLDSGSISTSNGFNDAGLAPNLIPLGSAAEYSLLANSVTNTAATHVNLDIGAHPGVIVGFLPGTTSGTIHGDDEATSQALTDATSAYTIAATRTKTADISGDLAGQTLGTGVYRAVAASAVSGTLILDGRGDPTAVFVFQIRAALTIAAGAKIILINGATSGNVFWQVAGAVTIGATADFAGIILGNAAISLGAGARIAGAALTHGGALSLANVLVETTPGFSGALTYTISGASFAPLTLSGLSTTISSATDSPWTVTDGRIRPAAWDLNITATTPTSAAGAVDTIPRTLPPGSLTISPGAITTPSGGPIVMHTAQIVLSDIPQRAAWSIASRGTFQFRPTIALTIPANTFRSNFSGSISDAHPNPYVSTITVTIG